MKKKNKKKQNINSIVIPLSLFISILHLINIGYKIKFIYYQVQTNQPLITEKNYKLVWISKKILYINNMSANEGIENLAALSESALASLIVPNLINPALDKVRFRLLNHSHFFIFNLFKLKQMEKEDPAVAIAKANIRNIFSKIDGAYPALAYDFITELLRAYNRNINLNEMILRSEKFATSDGEIHFEMYFLCFF